MAILTISKQTGRSQGRERRPVVVAEFVETELYQANARRRQSANQASQPSQESSAASPGPNDNNSPLQESIKNNPLLTDEEEQERRRSEILSAFLFGVGVGGITVGGVWFLRWMLSGSKTSLLEMALEKSY